MPIQEVVIFARDNDTLGYSVLNEVRRTLDIPQLTHVGTATRYYLEGITDAEARRLTEKLLVDPLSQEAILNEEKQMQKGAIKREIGYQPGVMNPAVGSLIKAAGDLGINLTAADITTEYTFNGNELTLNQVDSILRRLLVNKTVEQVITNKPDTLLISGHVAGTKIIEISSANDDALMELSKDKLFLDIAEMNIIKDYFAGLERNPTDCELEIIAARWSEHCGHKTFKAKVITSEGEKPPLITRITETAQKHFGELVVSAFADNSGVFRFYEGQTICGKVETHNSPSAIEPYGGAMTGSGGVFRDILGTGQGAKVIISTDMFCFAPPDLDPKLLPSGTLHPDYLQRRVVDGVRDYGNRMGIPTNNGSVHYHEDFRAKPTVIVGAYGIAPEERAHKGEVQINDLVVAIGGRTGRDGIHGATFSSGEMTDQTTNVNSSAVQIGNAIEEKRMADAIIEARDRGLIRAITDCGAAGFSSAIGELGEETGVTVDISNAPLKYPGLAPWEIWLSESQERMVLAIDPAKKEEFLEVCKKYNVEASILGVFDGSNKLTVFYKDEVVANLDYDFLKKGLPQREMKANWQKTVRNEKQPELPIDWSVSIKKVLAHGNVCSKEPIVRQYDHGVQGTNALAPFTGVNYDGPNDAVVITPILGKPYGMVASHGMNPILVRLDPYHGSLWAVAEAMANYVAVGGNPHEVALVNNYIWPFPDEESMGSLDQSVDAVVDSMNALKIPVISGKDSLSSTYRGPDGQIIKIPPVLCISAFGRIPDVEKTVSSDLKQTKSTLVLVGELSKELGGSTYFDTNGIVGDDVPHINLASLPKILETMHSAINSGAVLSCHDISEGGVIGALSEMAFGGDKGIKIDLDETNGRPDYFLFNETAGCFIAEVASDEVAKELFSQVPFQIIGKTQETKQIIATQNKSELFTANLDELKQAWQAPIKGIFH